MPITFTRQKRQSGNRGRDNGKAPGEATESDAAVPRQSTRSFVAPVTGSVKKSPSIKEHIQDVPAPEKVEPEKTEVTEATTAEQSEVSVESNVEEKEVAEVEAPVLVESEKTEPDHPLPEPETAAKEEENPKEKEPEVAEPVMSFADHWEKMVDLNFNKIPTVYYSLKEHTPEITNNIIYVRVKNEIQKEQIDEKQREMLAYLRNNFNDEIEDVQVLVDESLQTKTKLIDNRDKLKMLNEQNSSLPEFMQILNLVIKD